MWKVSFFSRTLPKRARPIAKERARLHLTLTIFYALSSREERERIASAIQSEVLRHRPRRMGILRDTPFRLRPFISAHSQTLSRTNELKTPLRCLHRSQRPETAGKRKSQRASDSPRLSAAMTSVTAKFRISAHSDVRTPRCAHASRGHSSLRTLPGCLVSSRRTQGSNVSLIQIHT